MNFDDHFLSLVVDAAPDGFLIVDAAGEIVFTNQQAPVLFGYEPDELVGLSVDLLLPEQLRASHQVHRDDYHAEPKVRPMGLDLELQGCRKDGTEFPVEISLSPLPSGDELFVLAAVRDVTARVAAEQRLRESETALREAEQVLAVAEDRERIARDLHDTVIQRLFASGLSLQATALQAEGKVRDRIENAIDALDQTIRDIRTAVFSLQANRPAEQGLRGLLLEVSGEAREPLGFEPRVQFEGPIESIDERIAEQLVPVIREALSNVAKHAQATDVRVVIRADGDVELVVTDDGVGAPEEVFGGNGLHNLRSRAEAMGGTFDIGPGEGGGTEIRWCVPASCDDASTPGAEAQSSATSMLSPGRTQ